MSCIDLISSGEDDDVWDSRSLSKKSRFSQVEKSSQLCSQKIPKKNGKSIKQSESRGSLNISQKRNYKTEAATLKIEPSLCNVTQNDSYDTYKSALDDEIDDIKKVSHSSKYKKQDKNLSAKGKLNSRSRKKKTSTVNETIKSEKANHVKSETVKIDGLLTPNPKRHEDRSGRCPVCQVPFSALSKVQSLTWHVDECLDQPYSSKAECSKGIDCDSTIVNHYKKYRHTQLARSARKTPKSSSASRSPSFQYTGDVANAKVKLDFDGAAGEKHKLLEVPPECFIDLDTSPIAGPSFSQRSDSDLVDEPDGEFNTKYQADDKHLHNKDIDALFDFHENESIATEGSKLDANGNLVRANVCHLAKNLEIPDYRNRTRLKFQNKFSNKEKGKVSVETDSQEVFTKIESSDIDSGDSNASSVLDIDNIGDDSRTVSDMLHDAFANTASESCNTAQPKRETGITEALKEILSSDSTGSRSSDDWDILKNTLTQTTFSTDPRNNEATELAEGTFVPVCQSSVKKNNKTSKASEAVHIKNVGVLNESDSNCDTDSRDSFQGFFARKKANFTELSNLPSCISPQKDQTMKLKNKAIEVLNMKRKHACELSSEVNSKGNTNETVKMDTKKKKNILEPVVIKKETNETNMIQSKKLNRKSLSRGTKKSRGKNEFKTVASNDMSNQKSVISFFKPTGKLKKENNIAKDEITIKTDSSSDDNEEKTETDNPKTCCLNCKQDKHTILSNRNTVCNKTGSTDLLKCADEYTMQDSLKSKRNDMNNDSVTAYKTVDNERNSNRDFMDDDFNSVSSNIGANQSAISRENSCVTNVPNFDEAGQKPKKDNHDNQSNPTSLSQSQDTKSKNVTPNFIIDDVHTITDSSYERAGGFFIDTEIDSEPSYDFFNTTNPTASAANALQDAKTNTTTAEANQGDDSDADNENEILDTSIPESDVESRHVEMDKDSSSVDRTTDTDSCALVSDTDSMERVTTFLKTIQSKVSVIQKNASDILMAGSRLLYGQSSNKGAGNTNALTRTVKDVLMNPQRNQPNGKINNSKIFQKKGETKTDQNGSATGTAKQISESQCDYQRKPRPCPFYKKIPGTSFTVDAFNYGIVPECRAYILSHFHYDHYIGLRKNFAQPIYCTKITANLVRSKIRVDDQYLHPIPLNTATVIEGVEITFLEANHCPGSVLILFKLKSGKVYLHTGDFRASVAMEMYPALQNIKIHALYLDTTYCDPQYAFPPQEEVIKFAVKLAVTAKTNNPKTLIVCGSYTIGKERIFTAIAEALQCKICVTRDKKSILDNLEDDHLRQTVSLSWQDSGLHVLPMNKLNYKGLHEHLLVHGKKYNCILGIEPTGWTFSKKLISLEHIQPKLDKENVKVYGIPYSEHSSYLEMKRFVQYTRPDKILPTVNNGNAHSRHKMEVIFDSWMEETKGRNAKSTTQASVSDWMK